MLARIEEARERQETLGGVAEVVALGVPPGVGSYSQWDTRLEAYRALRDQLMRRIRERFPLEGSPGM